VRCEWRWAAAAAIAFSVGVICAEPYARLVAPYYAAVDRLIATMQPTWTIDEVVVAQDSKSHGTVLRMTGEIRRQAGDAKPAAKLVARTQVGEAVETPMVFWALLLAWPAATVRQWPWRLALGIPIFLVLEGVTTAVQLVHSMAAASAILAGDNDPLTLWERWSRFLEAGGQFVLAAAGALLAVTAAAQIHVNSRVSGT